MRFVIADDQSRQRSYLLRTLRDAGHEVVAECSDGMPAVEACAKHRPDVVVLDISMKEMNGDIAAEQIRIAGTAQFIIIASSLAQGSVARPLIDKGATFISKPYSPLFLARLHEAIGG